MIEISEAIRMLTEGIAPSVEGAGFALYYPPESDRHTLPVTEERDTRVVTYAGDGNALRVEFTANTVSLFYADAAADVAQKGDFTRLSQNLLVAEEAEVSDVRFIIEEFNETLQTKFAKGKKPKTNKKLPASVSKAAVRNGAFYDLPSFGNRFTTIYPELRAAFKDNIDEYGEFLAEDFFKNHGTPTVLAIIRENNPQKMKKLFNLLNEIYDNGINDVQSLIVVSILGAMDNDETLLCNCLDYMNDELKVNVIRVNKFLASSAGKSARMRLENPPRYKPKKSRKGGMMSSLMGGAGTGLQQ